MPINMVKLANAACRAQEGRRAGPDLAELLVLEVVHFHAFGIALRLPIIADQFFFLRVHGYDGLAGRLSGKDFGVDV